MKVINTLKNLQPRDKSLNKVFNLSEEDIRLQGIHFICKRTHSNVSEYWCKKMCTCEDCARHNKQKNNTDKK